MNTIPPISNPREKNWIQPDTKDILVDNIYCVMSKLDFVKLHDYIWSIPTVKYEGKMWKALTGGIWYLYWYSAHPDPKRIFINRRIILLVDN